MNKIRALHGLSAVTHDSSSDNEVMQTALVGVANSKISHTINSSWLCYTPDAQKGALTSNLIRKYSTGYAVWQPVQSLNDWMTEADSIDVGHRRWILNPFLTKVALGHVDGIGKDGMYNVVSTLKVQYADELNSSIPAKTVNDYVAYPYGEYPKSYFDKQQANTDQTRIFSFSVIANPNQYWSNGSNGEVNFTNSSVTITNVSTGAIVPLLSLPKATYDNMGLQNNLQWLVDQAGIADNVTYQVDISHVVVKGINKNYRYTFSIKP